MKTFSLQVKLTILSLLSLNILVNSQNLNYSDLYLSSYGCVSGHIQSPLNLLEKNSTFNDSINVAYDGYNNVNGIISRMVDSRIEVGSVNHFVSNANDNFGYVIIDYLGVLAKYDLKRIYIHAPSEHKINNNTADLEIQFIHEKDLEYTSPVNQYRKFPTINTKLIVSALYNTTVDADTTQVTDNNFLRNVINSYYSNQNIDFNVATSRSTSFSMENTEILKSKRFFFYEGSETVTPCNEDALHYVIADSFSITTNDLNVVKNAFSSKFINGENTKTVASYNGRKVIRNYITEDELNIGYLSANSFLLFVIAIMFI